MFSYPEKAAQAPIIRLMLQAFAEGGTGTGGDGGTGDVVPDPGAQGEIAAEAAPSEEATPPDYDREFEEFLKRPEMKSRMDRRTQSAVRSRFKTAEAESQAAKELYGILGERYGVDPGDPAAIREAILADTHIDAERAEEEGMSLETFRELSRLRRQAKESEDRAAAEAEARRTASLRMQASRMAGEFPGFDLDRELGNPQFRKMLDAGVGVRPAYIAMHHGDIIPATVRRAQAEAEARVADTIRANQSRPSEGGAQRGAPAAPPVQDFSHMSSADFKSLCDRIMRGEQVTLG